MEESIDHRSHWFDILEGLSPQDDDFNSTFLPNSNFHVELQSPESHNYSQLNPNAVNIFQEEGTSQEERSARRKFSNRESARRTRMRKKKQIEQLQKQVEQLMMLNQHLHEKVINLLEINHQILQENSELKEKVSSFQFFMKDMQLPMRNA